MKKAEALRERLVGETGLKAAAAGTCTTENKDGGKKETPSTPKDDSTAAKLPEMIETTAEEGLKEVPLIRPRVLSSCSYRPAGLAELNP